MADYKQSKKDSSEAQDARSRWRNAPVDWGRVFQGRPHYVPQPKGETPEDVERDARAIERLYTKPIPYPMRAVDRYEKKPPEEIDQDTGEIMPAAEWERRTDTDGSRMWWPKMAHVRADMSVFRTGEARAAVERAYEDKRVKD